MTKWLQKQWEMIIDEVGTTRNKWGQRITDVNYILCTFLLRSGTSKSTWFKHCRVCTFQVLIPQTFRGPYFFRSWTARVYVPGSSNDQQIQVVLVIDPVFHATGRKLAQPTKYPQISAKRTQNISKRQQKSAK